MKKMTLWFTAITIIAGVTLALSKQGGGENGPLSQLRSANWPERAAALDKLVASPDALSSAPVKQALVDLLDSENQLVETTLRESNGQEGVSVKYGEGYAEYYATLLDAVEKLADSGDRRTLEVLTRAAYAPESPFALRLANHGAAVVPPLLELSNSDLAATRGKALGLLGEIMQRNARQTERMASDMQEQVQRALFKGAQDADVYVRVQAVRALGRAGGPDAVTLLQNLAQSDPATVATAEPGKSVFPVRDEAVKALRAIRTKTFDR